MPLLRGRCFCPAAASLPAWPAGKHRATLGISQKQVSVQPNQHMGVTAYPQSRTIPPSTSAPGEGETQENLRTLILVTVHIHFLCVYTHTPLI